MILAMLISIATHTAQGRVNLTHRVQTIRGPYCALAPVPLLLPRHGGGTPALPDKLGVLLGQEVLRRTLQDLSPKMQHQLMDPCHIRSPKAPNINGLRIKGQAKHQGSRHCCQAILPSLKRVGASKRPSKTRSRCCCRWEAWKADECTRETLLWAPGARILSYLTPPGSKTQTSHFLQHLNWPPRRTKLPTSRQTSPQRLYPSPELRRQVIKWDRRGSTSPSHTLTPTPRLSRRDGKRLRMAPSLVPELQGCGTLLSLKA